MDTSPARLDLRGLPLDRQLSSLRDIYVSLRGTGSAVRAQVYERPARLYISMLESGYRVSIEYEGTATILVLRPDGSTPRVGVRDAHSIVGRPDGKLYTNTTANPRGRT